MLTTKFSSGYGYGAEKYSQPERVIRPATPMPHPSRSLLSAIKGLLPGNRNQEKYTISPEIPASHQEVIKGFLDVFSPFDEMHNAAILGGTEYSNLGHEVIVAISFLAGDKMDQFQKINGMHELIASQAKYEGFQWQYKNPENPQNELSYNIMMNEKAFTLRVSGKSIAHQQKGLRKIIV